MNAFANRDLEVGRIEDAVTTLLDKQRLLRDPIIEFYGIEGIGKTTLLQKLRDRWSDRSDLSCVWTDIDKNPIDQFTTAKTLLAENKPVVVFIDALESANHDMLRTIEMHLS